MLNILGIGSSAVEQVTLNHLVVGSNPARCTKKFQLRLEFFVCPGESHQYGFRRDENSRAICEHQRAWRAGGQAETSVDESRAAAESRPVRGVRHYKRFKPLLDSETLSIASRHRSFAVANSSLAFLFNRSAS